MRLIDANALYKKTAEWEAQALHMTSESRDDPTEFGRWSTILTERSAFKHDVADAPTIDAVPVVRCRECWAYGTDNERAKAEYLNPDEYCALMRCEFPPDGYCSYGRRREDGDE